MTNEMSVTAAPDVTVVITSYNYGVFLPRCIESVITQNVPALEIVIVDNCSTDDSWAIIERYAAADGRIRPFRNETNVGLVGNHVRGLMHARGERVLFLSADDYLLPGHLRRALGIHREHPDIDIVFTTYFQVDEHDRVHRYLNHVGHLRGSYIGGRNEFAGLLTHDCYTCFPTTLFDRVALIESGGFDPDIVACDLEIYLRFAAAGKRFAFLDAPGACVRVHSESASGRDRYVATGKQLLEHLHLLERYLGDTYADLLSGHETGLGRLLQGKINNVLSYPIGSELLHANKKRVDAVVERLNVLLQKTLATPLPPDPIVSVIFRATDDINAVAAFVDLLDSQTYKRVELIVVADGKIDTLSILRDRCPSGTKFVTHRTPQSLSASLNDAARLVAGDVVVYGHPDVAWPSRHLERIVRALADGRVNAVTVPVDLIITRNGADVARYSNFTGGTTAETAARIGEGVPLISLAHRRLLCDIAGPFEEALTHLVDVEFVQRILSRGPLGVDDTDPVTLRTRYDELHPALLDPNGYMASLRAIYDGRPVDATIATMREAHFNRLANELRSLSASPDTGRAHLFTAIARGGSPLPAAKSRRRKRVLVIDDCVPYNELGRGYPRARSVVEALRDEGYDVVLYPLVRPYDDPRLSYGVSGVEILYGHGAELLGLTLNAMLDDVDLLWVSRPHNMRDVQGVLRVIGRPAPPIVYDAEAVYVERDRVRAELEGRTPNAMQHQEALHRELAYTDGCAVVSAVSEGERALIATRFRGAIEVLSFSIDANPTPSTFDERTGLLFVGAIEADSPNDDALHWFSTNVAPLVPSIVVRHAGVMRSDRLKATPVRFLGMVPDLGAVYNASKIFIAPTRFAAGLPQKVYEAAAHGIPVIATPLIARQTGWIAGRDLLVADSSEEWKSAIERLNSDRELWIALRNSALERVRSEVSPSAFRQRVASIARRAVDHEHLTVQTN